MGVLNGEEYRGVSSEASHRAILDSQSKVHEIYTIQELQEFPYKSTSLVHVGLEIRPELVNYRMIGMGGTRCQTHHQ